jgi:hypothetical protein
MGGGGHSSGGHFSGGHFAAAAGGHYASAASAHYASAAGPHYASAAGPHYASAAGAHYASAAGAHYASAAGPHYASAAGAHFANAGGAHYADAGPHFAGAPGANTVHAAAHGRFAGTSAMHAATHYSGSGGFVPGWNGGHAWGGGYWHGGFWPRCYFNPGFAWFLPILPFGYATFWWGGLPYYYWNNLYYTWSPADYGYVVTDPPPVAGGEATDSSSDGTYSGAADVYLYPRNGQSDAQTQNDRYECHSWAVNQTGFDPTRSSQQSSGSAADYRRAMIACLDARGYSAR